ncbi:MAG: DUF748 domain-containing protein [Simplicispira sp.]|nr:DUF748 domain-containing protein [Simplicispira sp.]
MAQMVAGVLLLWALGWLLVPPLLRMQGEKIATEKLGRQVTIGKIDFRPWTLELSVHDLAMASADGSVPQVQIKRIYIDAAMQSLLQGAPVLDALEIDGPALRLTQRAAGRHDLDDVMERLRPSDSPQAAPLEFALYNITVRDGSVDFTDEVLGRTHTLKNLLLQVPFLSNLPSRRAIKVEPHLTLDLNGSALDVMAQATPFTAKSRTEASIRLAALDLAPYLGYLPANLPVRLVSGVVDADVRVAFEQAPTTAVKISGSVQARQVKVVDGSQGALLSLDAIKVQVAEFQPLARLARIDAIELDTPRLTAHRNRSGQVNWALASAKSPASSQRSQVNSGNSAAAAAQPPAKALDWKLAVARVAVRGGQVDWLDESLPVSARVGLRELVLDASALALPFTHPLQFSGSTQVIGDTSPQKLAHVRFQGEATDQKAQVASSVQDFPLALAAPYLGQFFTPGLTGTLHAELGLAWNAPTVVAHVARLTVDGLELVCSAGKDCTPAPVAGVALRSKASLVELKKLQIEDAQVNLAQRSATVRRVALTQPHALVERAEDGRWMFERWQVAQAEAAPHNPPAPQATPVKQWSLQLDELSMDGAVVAFRDAAAPAPVSFLVSDLQVHLKNFAPLALTSKVSPLVISARMGAGRADPGRVQYNGTLGLAPLTAQGTVLATQVPLHALEPYFSDALNVRIRRADGSFKGQVQYAQTANGPQVQVNGDAALEEVRVRDRPVHSEGDASAVLSPRGTPGEDLLNWKALHLRGVQVALIPGKPMSLEVAETALSDFFARVVLQPSGRINLQEWVKGNSPAPSVSVNAAAPAATATTVQPQSAVSALAPVVRIGPITLAGGKIHFSDYFIQPNYSANISELTGRLGAFSSLASAGGSAPDMADLELRGRAEGTASLEIVGKLNPLVQPPVLDIEGHMRDLELPPLSPYTIKYAGHGIERGKLSMEVAYRVLPTGELTARNKLVLNQLAFSDPVEGAPASLPVRLAVALLADRNGVIDVELPISGSLNDPEFRLGSVILRVIGNLIMKSITAPFSLLASALGGSDAMDVVPFEPGSAALNDQARQQLDKVARALIDRPALKMTVAGQASEEAERSAWKRDRLHEMLLAQKRRTALRASQPSDTVTAVGTDEYAVLLNELYRRADIAKPRNLVGIAKNLPPAEVEALLLASISVPKNAMQELALARGVAVRDYLAQQQLSLQRLFLGAAKTVPSASEWTPHAELTLGTH